MKRLNFTPEEFPILIEALDAARAVVWSKRIEQPKPGEEVRFHVPGLKKLLGHSVTIRITFGNGTVDEHEYTEPEETIQ